MSEYKNIDKAVMWFIKELVRVIVSMIGFCAGYLLLHYWGGSRPECVLGGMISVVSFWQKRD